jgi:hypothetical protein
MRCTPSSTRVAPEKTKKWRDRCSASITALADVIDEERRRPTDDEERVRVSSRAREIWLPARVIGAAFAASAYVMLAPTGAAAISARRSTMDVRIGTSVGG